MLKTDDYKNFGMNFQILITNPINYLGKIPFLYVRITNPYTKEIYGISHKLEDIFEVLKFDTSSANDVKSLVSFGKDPKDPIEIKKGVGLYS